MKVPTYCRREINLLVYLAVRSFLHVMHGVMHGDTCQNQLKPVFPFDFHANISLASLLMAQKLLDN